MRAVTAWICSGPAFVHGGAGSNSTSDETCALAPRPDSHVLSSKCSTETASTPFVFLVTFTAPFFTVGRLRGTDTVGGAAFALALMRAGPAAVRAVPKAATPARATA